METGVVPRRRVPTSSPLSTSTRSMNRSSESDVTDASLRVPASTVAGLALGPVPGRCTFCILLLLLLVDGLGDTTDATLSEFKTWLGWLVCGCVRLLFRGLCSAPS